MTEAITYDGSALTTVRRESIRLVEAAKLGDVGMGSMILDDLSGALIPVGFKAVVVTQDAAPSDNQQILTGRAAARRFRRGQVAQISAGREIEVELLDGNVLLGDHVIWDTDGNRPSETISARLTWLLASTYVAFYDNGNVVYSSMTMDANDYRGQTPGDVVFDCANIAGYNYFIYYDEAAAQSSLFFDNSNTSSNYSTTTLISNVAADVDGTTVLAPLQDAELTRDPSKVASGVLVPYAKGSTYRTLAATATEFTSRDMVATTANIKTLAAAQALGDRLLEDNASEDDTITCSVWVLPANVNDIRAGHLMQVKFSHLPGYTAYTYVRVTKRTVSQPQNTDFRYQLDLELSPATPLFPQSSFARIDYPDDDYTGSTGGGSPIAWLYNGDNPKAGWVSAPKSGLMDYDTSDLHPGQSNPVGHASSGIKMNGSGTVDIYCRVTGYWGMHGASSGTTITVKKKGGATIVSVYLPDAAPGIHIWSVDQTLTATGVSVTNGDILECTFDLGRSEGDGMPGSAYIGYQATWFYATGSLA